MQRATWYVKCLTKYELVKKLRVSNPVNAISCKRRLSTFLPRVMGNGSRPTMDLDVFACARTPGISSHGVLLHSSCVDFLSTKVLSDNDIKKQIDEISEKFKEAMELLEDARSSVDTVYFSEDMNDADNAIREVLSDYEVLLGKLSDEQKHQVVRTIGLKMEELKAQVHMIKDSLR